MNLITESQSNYNDLENKSIQNLLTIMNDEDKTVAYCIEKVKLNIIELIDFLVKNLKEKGRLFYIGAGTSGRLGVLDASEIPPTFGLKNKIIGIIAGGTEAVINAVENAEDSIINGWLDLEKHQINSDDFVIGISASGTTPYVYNALLSCQKNKIKTGSITCNHNSKISQVSDFPIEVILGSEVISGSTRLKSGSAQKMILNCISSIFMIKLGKVQDNFMIDMRLNSNKLNKRAISIISKKLNISQKGAEDLLEKYKTVRGVFENL